MKERTKFLLLLAAFGAAYFLPIEAPRTQTALLEGLFLLKDYARQHVLLCLVPALFIAGASGVFVAHESVMKYLGPRAPRVLAYGVASVSGTVLAVCSCTVLPLFAGIYARGAGLGPATAFLYAGPAINVLAIVLRHASWASSAHAKEAEIRMYDRLFTKENPEEGDEGFLTCLNPNPWKFSLDMWSRIFLSRKLVHGTSLSA